MVQQYLRLVSLIVGNAAGNALDLSQLRIRFRVRRDVTQTLNYFDAMIYNVSTATFSRVRDEFTRVVLQAGYAGNIGTIFDGTIIQARYGRDSATDTHLGIVARDGDAAYHHAVVNKTLAAGATPNQQIAAALEAMAPHGITAGQIDTLPATALPRGVVMYGMARDYLGTVARNAGRDWFIDAGQLHVTSQLAYQPGQAVVLTPSTGLIGIPENTADGIRLRCLLNPVLAPNKAIRLDNTQINDPQFSAEFDNLHKFTPLSPSGTYKVAMVEHVGDTRGNEFYSDVTCVAVDASAPVSRSVLGVTPDVF